MNSDTWQHLLGLESVDVVCGWHKEIHDRHLNARRATEITSSAKQAREYFRNAANSANPSIESNGRRHDRQLMRMIRCRMNGATQ